MSFAYRDHRTLDSEIVDIKRLYLNVGLLLSGNSSQSNIYMFALFRESSRSDTYMFALFRESSRSDIYMLALFRESSRSDTCMLLLPPDKYLISEF